jgi:hypothetical protein
MLTGSFIPGAYAPGAQVKADGSAVDSECSGLDVRQPGAPGMLLGVADAVTEPQRFFADITFDSQFKTSSLDTLLIKSKNDI